MARLFHWHAPVPTTLTGNCGARHHPDCTRFVGFTNANEFKCSVPGGGPAGKPHKCWHTLPDNIALWKKAPARRRATVSKAKKRSASTTRRANTLGKRKR